MHIPLLASKEYGKLHFGLLGVRFQEEPWRLSLPHQGLELPLKPGFLGASIMGKHPCQLKDCGTTMTRKDHNDTKTDDQLMTLLLLLLWFGLRPICYFRIRPPPS